MRLPYQDSRQQAVLKLFDLAAGIAQTGHLKHHVVANSKQGGFRKSEKIDAARRNVFAELCRRQVKALRCQFVEQLGVDQVNLTKVRLVGVYSHSGAMLDQVSLMGVSLDAEPGDDLDLGRPSLRESMFAVSRDSNDTSGVHIVRDVLARESGKADATWRARKDSNLRPSESKSDALSS